MTEVDTAARKTVAEAGPRRAVEIGPAANLDAVAAWLAGLGIDAWSVYDLTHVKDRDGRHWLVAKIAGPRDDLGRVTCTAERIVPFDTKPPAGVTT